MTDETLASPIAATIDYEKDGTQHGFLRLPYSRDDSAWGSVMIPISVVKNGVGPTALLTGGNHGDEYEGPIALYDLANSLKNDEISGRVIIVPGMNFPAFEAGSRTSPIDKGNLNRSFPGRPDGTVTQKIADYFQRVLLPLADVIVDCHSGGKTLDFLPFSAAHVLPNKVQETEAFRLAQAFGAPYSVKMLEIDAMGMFDTSAEAMGKIFLTGELGGGGTATSTSVARAKRGLRNVLKAAGVLKGDAQHLPTQLVDMPDEKCFAFAQDSGLIEFCYDLGASVKEGEPIARIWSLHKTGAEPKIVKSPRSGLFLGRHFPGLVKAGDCVVVIAEVL
jgi:N-alpha-acetyl-L-2,4-diaminobutyrate deacetylase